MQQPPRPISIGGGTFAALIIGALALTVSACSAGHTTERSPATTPTAPVADPAKLTREQGAAKYLKIVAPHNEAMDKCLPVLNPLLESGESSPSDFGRLRAACADIPKTNRQFADNLTKTTWPAEARSAAVQLADELRADQLAWQEIANARTHDDLFAPTYPLTEDGTGAELIRAHLGLPAVEEVEGG